MWSLQPLLGRAAPRLQSALLLAASLVMSAAGLRAQEAPTTLGALVVPSLPGWARTEFRSDVLSSVTFDRQADGVKFRLKVTLFPPMPPGFPRLLAPDPPPVIQFLKSDDATDRFVSVRDTSYLGSPAYFIEKTYRSRGLVHHLRGLNFVVEGDEYMVTLGFSSTQRLSPVPRVAETGWRSLLAGIKRAKK